MGGYAEGGEPFVAKGKYHEWLTDEGLLKIEGWARDGLIDKDIAKNIGVTEQTLNVWKKKYPSFFESLKRGKEVVDRQVENALFKRALGYKYDEVTYEDGVETKRVTKEVVPDTTAQIFWLKNRKPEVWRDKQSVEISGSLDQGAKEMQEYMQKKWQSKDGKKNT